MVRLDRQTCGWLLVDESIGRKITSPRVGRELNDRLVGEVNDGYRHAETVEDVSVEELLTRLRLTLRGILVDHVVE